jgi:UDP-N-acetylmuramoylalanine--D-glutamate ligase
MNFSGKRVLIVGLARSGVGAANLLTRLGASVTVTDKKKPHELEKFLRNLDPSIKRELGHHPSELFANADLIVISPGVPVDIAPLKLSSAKGIKIIGELELAYQIVKCQVSSVKRQASGARSHCPSFLAVTGTNGKSTTTALLYEIVRNSGFNVLLGGNIGNALTDSLLVTRYSLLDYIVAEVSSFQLESIDAFRPKGAAILNITADHMDRYHSISDYTDAKCRIFMNQSSKDFLVLNADDPATKEITQRVKNQSKVKMIPEIFYFSREIEVEGAYYQDNAIKFNLPESKISKIQNLIPNQVRDKIQQLPSAFSLQPSVFKIKGVHNIENAMAASLMALLSGCSPDVVADTLKTFPGLEHRLEFVRETGGVKFINDSKGTNVGAVIKSLESFHDPVILIAGGRDKDSDFRALRHLVKDRVKAVVLIGEAKEKIKHALGDAARTVFLEDDLRSAVLRAKEMASPGDVVLLSPACASFDMFIDFENRGRQFKKIVEEMP